MRDFRLGPAVRTRLGRFEIPAADAYRAAFINLDAAAQVLASVAPAKRILEIGCGDGSFGQRLLERYPDAEYVGIDIADEPGRLFRGDRSRASFRSTDSATFLATEPEPFDLVVMVDVVHHIPQGLRDQVLREMRALTAPGGRYAIKEWDPVRGPVHAACWALDRYVTGDRIEHIHSDDLKAWVSRLLGDRLVLDARVPPHRHNYLVAYERGDTP
jgi:2-polyprenyl-6-hydroxyphenyl methylase/3-demethylubiquinone-9 3-methyltransferase